MRHRTHTHRLCSSLALAMVLAFGVLPGLESPAGAVKSTGTFRITPVPAGSGLYATYSFGTFETAKNETVTRARIEFPPECDVSSAVAVDSGDSLIISGQRVTVLFGTPKPQQAAFTVRIGNIRNPTLPSVYDVNQTVVFTEPNGSTQNHTLKKTDFTILESPYLLLTIDTPDGIQDVDFGSVQPGSSPAPKTVLVAVDSSLPYTMTRSITGQVSDLGLSVSGPAEGSKPAGYAEYGDVYSIAPPWTTEPGAYSVAVQYTVVHP